LLLPCQGLTQQKSLLQLLPASLCCPQVKQQLEGLTHVVSTVGCCTSFGSSITGDDLAMAAAAAARREGIIHSHVSRWWQEYGDTAHAQAKSVTARRQLTDPKLAAFAHC
jgi:hypothetical protein